MTKSLLAFFLLISASSAGAATRLQFLPGNQNAMAIITATAPDGASDDDSLELLKIMNVPLQSSPLGPGKSIVTAQRDFNLVCGEQRKQCQVILSRSMNVDINSRQKKMSFRVTGAEAAALRAKFHPENTDAMEFVTVDEKFVIRATENEFIFSAEEKD